MSNVIDQRIVEMKFDNSDFEKNVKTSMESLENLKKSIDSAESVKAFENIGEASNNLKLEGISGAVEAVQNKFSALETIAIGALLKIGSQAVDAGEKLLKSFTVDNVAAGWNKFAEKTVSVGTLISQGFDMKEVEDQLDRLAWFTDETSYNFTDMVSNIGKFTASGKGLTESVTAMEGIATWAALSGQNATKASSAMYQLAQAMGKGALKLDDFKSIQNVSMDTDEFRQKSLDAAVAVGTLTKETNGLYKVVGTSHTFSKSQFTEYLTKDAWYTSEVMLKVFNEYSAAVEQIYSYAEEEGITASEAMAKYGDQIDTFGLKAFKAAQEARTWGDVVDSVKDAVSSTWMKTFELIFGNYEEAKVLWTKLANQLYDVFAEGGNLRNELLEQWKKLGGRDTLLWSFSKLGKELITIIDTIKEAFHELFPETTAKDLMNITFAFRDFTIAIGLNDESTENLKDTFKGFFSILRLVCDIVNEILKILFPVLKKSGSLLETILKITGAIGRFITGATYLIKKNDLIAKGFNAVATAIKYAIGFIFAGAVALADFISKLYKMDSVQTALNKIGNALSKVMSAIKVFAVLVVAAFAKVYEWITKLVNTKFVTNAINKLKILGNIVTETIKNIVDKVKDFFELFKKADGIGEKIDVIKDKLIELKDKVFGLFTDEDDPITQLDGAASKSDFIRDKLLKISDAVKTFCSVMTPGRIAAFGFAAAVIGIYLSVAKLTTSFSAAGTQITSFFKTLNKNFNPLKKGTYAYELEKIAFAIALVAGSLYLISKIDSDKMLKSLGMLSAVIGELLVVGVALSAINKFIGPIEGTGVAILALAGGVAILAAAFLVLDKVNMEGIWQKVLVIGAVAAELAVTSTLLSLMKHPIRGALTLLAFALSISKAINALALLADIDYTNIRDNLKYILLIIGGMAALSLAAGNLSLGSMIGVYAMAVLLQQVFPVLKELSKVEFDLTPLGERIEKSKKPLIALGVFIGALAVLAGLLGKGAVRFGIGIGILTICVYSLIKFSKELDKLTPEQFAKGVKTMAGAMALFAIMSVCADFTSYSKMISFSVSILIMTGAIALLIQLGKYAGNIDDEQFKQGAKAIVGLMAMIALLEGLSALTGRANNKAITAMILGLVVMFGEMVVLSLIPFKDLISAAVSMGVLMLALGGALALASSGRRVRMANVLQMILMAGIMIEFATILSKLVKFSWKKLAAATASMSICLLAFGGACRLITNLDGRTLGATGKNNILSNKMKAMIIVCGVMATLGAALYLAAKNPWGDSLGAMGAMVGCIAALAGVCWALTKIKGIKIDSARYMLELATALLPIALAIAFLADYEWNDIKDGLLAMGLSLAALLGAAAILTLISTKLGIMGSIGKELVALSVAMIAIAVACKIFQGINVKELGSAGAALLAITAALAALMALNWASAGLGSLALGALAAVFIALGTAGLELAIGLAIIIPLLNDLQNVNLTKFGNSLRPLSDQLIRIGVASVILSAGVYGLLGFAVAAFVVSAAAYVLAKGLDVAANAVKKLTEIKSVSILTTFMALSKAMRYIADVGKECFDGLILAAVAFYAIGNAALVSAVSFAIFTFMLPGLASGIEAVNRALQNIDTEKLSTQLKEIGEGLKVLGLASIALAIGSSGLISFAIASVAVAIAAVIFAGALNLLDNVKYDKISEGFDKLGKSLINLIECNAWDLAGTAAGIIALAIGLSVLSMSSLLMNKAAEGMISISLALSKLVIVASTAESNDVNLYGLGTNLAYLGYCLMVLGLGGVFALAGSAGIATTSLALKSLITNIGSVDTLKELAEGLSELTPKLYNLGFAGVVLLIGSAGIATMASALAAINPALAQFVKLDLENLSVNVSNLKDSALGLAAAGLELGVGAPGMHAMATALLDITACMLTANLTFTNTCKNINSTFVKEMGKLYKEGIKAGEDALRGILKGSQDNSLKANIKKAWENVVNNDIFGPLHTVGGWGSPWAKLIIASKDALQGMVEGSNDPSKKATLKSAWKDVCQEGVMSNLSTLAADAKTKIGEVWNQITSLGNYSNAISTVTNKVGKGVNNIMDMKDIINDYINSQLDLNSITEEATNIADEYANSLSNTGSSASTTKDQLSELTDTISGQIDIFGEFSAKTDMTSEKLLSNMKSQIEGVKNWANMMQTLGERGIDQGLLEYLGNLGPQGYEYVNAFVNMTADQLGQAGTYFQESLTLPGEAAKQITGSYALAGAWAAEGFANGLTGTQAAENAAKMGLDTLQRLKDVLGIHSPSKEMQTIGTYTIEGYKYGLRLTYYSQLYPYIWQLGRNIVSTFKTVLSKDNFVSIGAYVVEGLNEGLDSTKAIVLAKAEEIGKAVIAKMNKGSEVASPSKAAIRTGRWIDIGLANGLSSYASIATNAAEDVGSQTVALMQEAIGRISDVMDSDMEMNPTITPVLDMSNIQNGISDMNALFSKGVNVSAGNASKASVSSKQSTASGYGSSTDSSSQGTTWNFTQNNYSPTALSRIDIYRQTRNQLSQVRGATT